LEREKATSKTMQQLRELREQESAIRSRMLALHSALQPSLPQSRVEPVLSVRSPMPVKKPWYRSLGCMVVSFLFWTPVWSLLILTDKEQKKVVKIIAAIILVLYVIVMIAALSSGGTS